MVKYIAYIYKYVEHYEECYIYIGDVYIYMSRTYKVTNDHKIYTGTLYTGWWSVYIYIYVGGIYILNIECWTYNVTTFRGIAKPPTYIICKEHAYNNGTLYINIYRYIYLLETCIIGIYSVHMMVRPTSHTCIACGTI